MPESDSLGQGLFVATAIGLLGFATFGFDGDPYKLTFIVFTLTGVLYLD